jgi:hypothetical protein
MKSVFTHQELFFHQLSSRKSFTTVLAKLHPNSFVLQRTAYLCSQSHWSTMTTRTCSVDPVRPIEVTIKLLEDSIVDLDTCVFITFMKLDCFMVHNGLVQCYLNQGLSLLLSSLMQPRLFKRVLLSTRFFSLPAVLLPSLKAFLQPLI